MVNKSKEADNIFECQKVLSEVIFELIVVSDTRELGISLSKLNNGELERIRKELLK